MKTYQVRCGYRQDDGMHYDMPTHYDIVTVQAIDGPACCYCGAHDKPLSPMKRHWICEDCEMAERYIKCVAYDPSVHGENNVDAEPGDEWFVFYAEADEVIAEAGNA